MGQKGFFNPGEVLELAHEAGLKNASIIFTKDMEQKYFADRANKLLPATAKFFLLAEI